MNVTSGRNARHAMDQRRSKPAAIVVILSLATFPSFVGGCSSDEGGAEGVTKPQLPQPAAAESPRASITVKSGVDVDTVPQNGSVDSQAHDAGRPSQSQSNNGSMKPFALLSDALAQRPSEEFVSAYKDARMNAGNREIMVAWQMRMLKDFSAADLLASARTGRIIAGNYPDRTNPTALGDSTLSDNQIHSQLAIAKGVVVASLQYYPMKFEGLDGVPPLLDIIRDRTDDWFLRYFLISSVEAEPVPRLGPENINTTDRGVQSYVAHYIQKHPKDTLVMLEVISEDSRDHPFVRARAFRLNWRWSRSELRHALELDANIAAYQREHSEDADIQTLVREGKVHPTRKSSEKLAQIQTDIRQQVALARDMLNNDDFSPFAKDMVVRTLSRYRDVAIDGRLYTEVATLVTEYTMP